MAAFCRSWPSSTNLLKYLWGKQKESSKWKMQKKFIKETEMIVVVVVVDFVEMRVIQIYIIKKKKVIKEVIKEVIKKEIMKKKWKKKKNVLLLHFYSKTFSHLVSLRERKNYFIYITRILQKVTHTFVPSILSNCNHKKGEKKGEKIFL